MPREGLLWMLCCLFLLFIYLFGVASVSTTPSRTHNGLGGFPQTRLHSLTHSLLFHTRKSSAQTLVFHVIINNNLSVDGGRWSLHYFRDAQRPTSFLRGSISIDALHLISHCSSDFVPRHQSSFI